MLSQIINKIYRGIVFAILSFLLTSCAEKNLYLLPETGQPYETEVTFSMQVPGNYNPATRALLTGDENEVRSVEVLVFEKDGNFSYSRYADDITVSGNTRTFTVSLKTGNFDIMVLANSRGLIEDAFGGGIPAGTVRTVIGQELAAEVTGKWNTSTSSGGYIPIPMWGEKKNVTINASTSFTGADQIKLTRMLARIDVTVDPAIRGTFKLREVYLYNHYQKGLVIPDTRSASWNGSADRALAPTIGSGWTPVNGFLKYDGAEITTTGISCERAVYTFEATAGSTAGYSGNTFLVVGGEYGGEMCYYRVDFAKTSGGVTSYLPLLRNHRYTANIKELNSKGHGTHQLAAASLPMNIVADMTVSDEAGVDHYAFDGQYYLGTDSDALDFWSVAASSQIMVVNDNPAGWTYTVSNLADGSGGTPTWLNNFSRTDNGAGNTDRITFDIEANPSNNTSRTAYIHLSAGKLSLTVKVTQNPYYISSAGVSPKGEIPSTGGTYTIALTGSFDNTPVHAWDITADASIAETFVPAHSSGNSTTLVVDELWQPGTRTVVFRYYDLAENMWKTISTADQDGFDFAVDITNHTDGGIIPGEGGFYSIEVTGNYPALRFRAVTDNNLVVSNVSSIPAANITGYSSVTLTGNQSWDNTRNVVFQRSFDGINWTPISEGVQQTYKVEFTFSHTQNGSIAGGGDKIEVRATGYFPSLEFRAVSGSTIFPTTAIIDAGTTAMTRVLIPNNEVSTTRPVDLEYRRSSSSAWILIYSGTQKVGRTVLKSGRILAQENASISGTGTATYMTWLQAMGLTLTSDFSDSFFYQSGYSSGERNNYGYNNYHPYSVATGCAAYSEEGTQPGDWVLPTAGEALEFASRQAISRGYWTSTENYLVGNAADLPSTAAARMYNYSTGNSSTVNVDKLSVSGNGGNNIGVLQIYARCVRNPF